MNMHNPPHPGEFISATYLKPFKISSRKLATHLNVSPSTASRLLAGDSDVSPEMALKLSAVLGRTPESWLAMQDNFDLWAARKAVDTSKFKRLELAAE